MNTFGYSPASDVMHLEFKMMQVYLNVEDYLLICM